MRWTATPEVIPKSSNPPHNDIAGWQRRRMLTRVRLEVHDQAIERPATIKRLKTKARSKKKQPLDKGFHFLIPAAVRHR